MAAKTTYPQTITQDGPNGTDKRTAELHRTEGGKFYVVYEGNTLSKPTTKANALAGFAAHCEQLDSAKPNLAAEAMKDMQAGVPAKEPTYTSDKRTLSDMWAKLEGDDVLTLPTEALEALEKSDHHAVLRLRSLPSNTDGVFEVSLTPDTSSVLKDQRAMDDLSFGEVQEAIAAYTPPKGNPGENTTVANSEKRPPRKNKAKQEPSEEPTPQPEPKEETKKQTPANAKQETGFPVEVGTYLIGGEPPYKIGKPTAACVGDWVARMREYGRKQELPYLTGALLLAALPLAVPEGKKPDKPVAVLTEMIESGAVTDEEPAAEEPETPAEPEKEERTDEQWGALLRGASSLDVKNKDKAARMAALKKHYGWDEMGRLERMAVVLHHYGLDWNDTHPESAKLVAEITVGEAYEEDDPSAKDFARAEKLQKRWWAASQESVNKDPNERVRYHNGQAKPSTPGQEKGEKPTTPKKPKAAEIEIENDTDIPAAQRAGAKGGRYEVFGFPVTAVLRWMGKNDWKVKQARCVLDKMGLQAVATPTLQAQIGAGRNGQRGDPAALTPAQVKQLNDLRSECETTA